MNTDSATPTPAQPRPLILIVEDEAPVRELLSAYLEFRGYEVIAAEDGLRGVAAFKERRGAVRAVLTDTMMPGMDGVAVVRAIREMDQRVPIISASGCPDPGTVGQLKALNVTAFLRKPYLATEMGNLVDAVTHDYPPAP
jgi:CheY-like chemotaxis protein